MKRALITLVMGSLTLVAPLTPGMSQERPGVQQLPEGLTFDFQNTDLRAVITALAEVAGLNIVYTSIPARPITLRTSQPIPLSEVRGLLESVVRANGLELVDEGVVLQIVPAVAAPPRDAVEAPGLDGERRLYMHRLRHARAVPIVQTLRTLFGLQAIGGEERDGRLRSLSEQLREQRRVPFIQPEAPPPAEAAPQQQQGVSVALRAPVELVPDPVNNAILILATPADFETIRAAITQIDARPLQVLIEVTIAEYERDDVRDLGIDVTLPFTVDDTEVDFRLRGLSAGDVALDILGIGSSDADVILRALAQTGRVRIVSRPLVLAKNNGEARILVGDQRPFVQLFRALPTDDAVRDQVVQYRNVGTQLVIRPTINDDGYIDMAILQEVSNATAETQFGAPVINTREVETELLIRDGQTAVLGGLMSEQAEEFDSGVPLLKEIPILGYFFQSTRTRNIKTELLLLLRPRVIRDDEDLDEATQQIEQNTQELKKQLQTPRDTIR